MKAFFTLTQESGHDEANRSIQIGADSDFDDSASTFDMLLRDVTEDSTVYYALPSTVRAEGTAFSLKYSSQFGDGYALAWNSFIIAYEVGGFLQQ